MRVIGFLLLSLLLCFSGLRAQKLEQIAELKGSGRIELLLASPCMDIFITGDSRGTVSVYDANSFTLLNSFKAYPHPVSSISFNNDCSKMITASRKGLVSIWDTRTWKLLYSYVPLYPARTTFAVFSPDEQYVYFDLNYAALRIKANLDQSLVEIYRSPFHIITSGMISPDKNYLLIGSDQSIKVFDFKLQRVVKTIGTCSSYVNEIAFIDESLFTTWCQDGTLNHWDLYQQGALPGRPLKTKQAGKDGTWTQLYVSGNKQYLITSDGGRAISLWEPYSGKLITSATAHQDTVRAFAFSRDSKFLFTGGFDGYVKKWKIAGDTLSADNTNLKKDTIQSASLPDHLRSRTIEKVSRFTSKKEKIEIEIWDDNVDGDIISLSWNGLLILKNYEVTKERKKLELTLSANTSNDLVLYAENLGLSPPNTARLSFSDGKKTHVIKLSSDLNKSGAVSFVYEP